MTARRNVDYLPSTNQTDCSGPFLRGWGGEIKSEGRAKERQKGVCSVIMLKTIATIYQELA